MQRRPVPTHTGGYITEHGIIYEVIHNERTDAYFVGARYMGADHFMHEVISGDFLSREQAQDYLHGLMYDAYSKMPLSAPHTIREVREALREKKD